MLLLWIPLLGRFCILYPDQNEKTIYFVNLLFPLLSGQARNGS